MKKPTTSRKVQEATAALQTLVDEIAATGPQEDSCPFFFSCPEYGEVGLDLEQFRAYTAILDSLAPDEGMPAAHSRYSIERCLRECIAACLFRNPDQPYDQAKRDSFAHLKQALTPVSRSWTIWGPVFQFTVPPEGFDYGNVFFCSDSHPDAKAISRRFDSVRGWKAKSTSSLVNGPPAQHTFWRTHAMAADKDAAMDKAEFEIQSTIEVLNFFASRCYPPSKRPHISTSHNPRGFRIPILYLASDSKAWGGRFAHPASNHTFAPGDLAENKTLEAAFAKASQMLKDNSGGSRILSALRWAGKAAMAQKRENAFVFYAIALEALLLGDKHTEQLAYKLRLRAAHLLGSDKRARGSIRDRVRDLYALRSKIVHCGKLEIARSDLEDIQSITEACIVRLLSAPFSQTEETLENWFEESLL